SSHRSLTPSSTIGATADFLNLNLRNAKNPRGLRTPLWSWRSPTAPCSDKHPFVAVGLPAWRTTTTRGLSWRTRGRRSWRTLLAWNRSNSDEFVRRRRGNRVFGFYRAAPIE